MEDFELWQGDCLALMDRIPDGSVDCIICDLPYGITKNKWDSVIPFNDYTEISKGLVSKEEFLMDCFKHGVFYDEALEYFESPDLLCKGLMCIFLLL